MNKIIGLFKKGSPKQIIDYWNNPNDKNNAPENYFKGKDRSEFLLRIIKSYAEKDNSIMELGCSVGRNLNYLWRSGFHNLSGVEINRSSTLLMQTQYKELGQNALIFNDSIENALMDMQPNAYDVVFTMAVFEHIPYYNNWIFNKVHNITGKYLITIEDEKTFYSWRHFPRNYKKYLEVYGFNQVEEISCKNIKGLGKNFICRVFKKETSLNRSILSK